MGLNRPERSAGSFWTIAAALAPTLIAPTNFTPTRPRLTGVVMLGAAHSSLRYLSQQVRHAILVVGVLGLTTLLAR